MVKFIDGKRLNCLSFFCFFVEDRGIILTIALTIRQLDWKRAWNDKCVDCLFMEMECVGISHSAYKLAEKWKLQFFNNRLVKGFSLERNYIRESTINNNKWASKNHLDRFSIYRRTTKDLGNSWVPFFSSWSQGT